MTNSLSKIFDILIRNNYLPSPELIEFLLKKEDELSKLEELVKLSKDLNLDKNITILDVEKIFLLKKQDLEVNWKDIDLLKVYLEKNKNQLYLNLIKHLLKENYGILEDYLNLKLMRRLEFENYILENIKHLESNNLDFTNGLKKNENVEKINSVPNTDNNFENGNNKNNNYENNEVDIVVEDSQLNSSEKNSKNKEKEIAAKDEEIKNELSNGLINKNFKESNLIKKNEKKIDNNKDKDLKEVSNISIDKKEVEIYNKRNLESSENKTSDEKIIGLKNLLEKIPDEGNIFENLNIKSHFSQNKIEWVENNFKILRNYENKKGKKLELSDFLTYFRNKYREIKSLLINRSELNNLVSVSDVKSSNEYSIIAMVRDINIKNNKMVLLVEDLSGTLKVIIDLKNKDLQNAIEIVPDDVIGIKGKLKGKFFYANKIIFPDVPNNSVSWLKDHGIDEDTYAIVLSDIHVGSKLFLRKKFELLLRWLNGYNNKFHGKIAYVLFAGDLIDGIGVYPEQIEELDLHSAQEQYNEFAKLVEQIPSEINVFINPGNHDAIRLAEPQPVLEHNLSESLKELNNVYLLSNPSELLLRDHIRLLMYHGYSYDYFINNLDHLRSHLSYDHISKLMAFLMRKRHLVPSYGASPINPEKDDLLFIRDIPNFMVSGHVHKSSIGSYKGIKFLSSSCWQARTPFQEKVGHNPDPGKIPMINLKDGSVTLLKF